MSRIRYHPYACASFPCETLQDGAMSSVGQEQLDNLKFDRDVIYHVRNEHYHVNMLLIKGNHHFFLYLLWFENT